MQHRPKKRVTVKTFDRNICIIPDIVEITEKDNMVILYAEREHYNGEACYLTYPTEIVATFYRPMAVIVEEQDA